MNEILKHALEIMGTLAGLAAGFTAMIGVVIAGFKLLNGFIDTRLKLQPVQQPALPPVFNPTIICPNKLSDDQLKQDALYRDGMERVGSENSAKLDKVLEALHRLEHDKNVPNFYNLSTRISELTTNVSHWWDAATKAKKE